MRKIPFMILLLSGIPFLTLTACHVSETEKNVLEEIRLAPVVKLECAEQQNSQPIFVDNVVTTTSIVDMRIQSATEAFDEEWLYRFTYNPNEKVINGHEIVVLFGSTCMEIDGTTYTPEDGVNYDKILEWAEVVYHDYMEL